MLRFFYNHVFRPLLWVIPAMIVARTLGLPTDWHLWLFVVAQDVLYVTASVLFPYADKPTRNPAR